MPKGYLIYEISVTDVTTRTSSKYVMKHLLYEKIFLFFICRRKGYFVTFDLVNIKLRKTPT